MVYKKPIPEEIKEYISYDPESGVLVRKRHNFTPGKIQRCPWGLNRPLRSKDTAGSIQVWFRDQFYLGHRVAWFLMTGKQPNIIDHKNGIRDDNRFCNLKNTTQSRNLRNSYRHRNEGKITGIKRLKNKRRSIHALPYRYIVVVPCIDSNLDRDLYIKTCKTKAEAKNVLYLTKKLFKQIDCFLSESPIV